MRWRSLGGMLKCAVKLLITVACLLYIACVLSNVWMSAATLPGAPGETTRARGGA